MMLVHSFTSRLLVFVTALAAASTDAYTAVLFGASGAVGSEVYRALLLQQQSTENDSTTTTPFWDNIVIVGRRELQLEQQPQDGTNVTQVVVPDLTKVDENEQLKETIKADACIIAVGAGYPMTDSLRQWHAVDVDMPGSIARLCKTMEARYISLLSAVDASEEPKPYSEQELSASGDKEMGFVGTLVGYFRIKGLAELAVASTGAIPFVRIFQPSNIVTDYIRYGWLDWTIFKIIPFIDPILPDYYKSVHVRLLGMAMAGDAVQVLGNNNKKEEATEEGVTRLTYTDYVRIAGKEFEAEQKDEQEQGSETKEL